PRAQGFHDAVDPVSREAEHDLHLPIDQGFDQNISGRGHRFLRCDWKGRLSSGRRLQAAHTVPPLPTDAFLFHDDSSTFPKLRPGFSSRDSHAALGSRAFRGVTMAKIKLTKSAVDAAQLQAEAV